jgi:hypothetical protein
MRGMFCDMLKEILAAADINEFFDCAARRLLANSYFIAASLFRLYLS